MGSGVDGHALNQLCPSVNWKPTVSNVDNNCLSVPSNEYLKEIWNLNIHIGSPGDSSIRYDL